MTQFKDTKSAQFNGTLADAGARMTAFMRNNPNADFLNSMIAADFSSGSGALWVVFSASGTVNTTGVDEYRDNGNPANDFG